jgi:hypothetical protein
MTTTVDNISKSQTLKVGATTVTAYTMTTLPLSGVHSLHDCTDPGYMGLYNCVWPSDYENGSGLKMEPTATTAALAASVVGVSVTNGLTINMRDGGVGNSGNVSVTFT